MSRRSLHTTLSQPWGVQIYSIQWSFHVYFASSRWGGNPAWRGKISLATQKASQEVFGILSPGKHELVLKFLLTVNVDWIQLLLVDLTFWERQTSISGDYVEFLELAKDALVGDERQCIKYWRIRSLFQSIMNGDCNNWSWFGEVMVKYSQTYLLSDS